MSWRWQLQALWPLLPAGKPPAESEVDAYTAWREQLQQALVCALDEVQVTFACIGHPSGTTVTILIQVSSNGPESWHKGPPKWVQAWTVEEAAAALAL
jgi:hypothetical protein